MRLDFVAAWNTGRMYTEKGQRIACWLVEPLADSVTFDPFLTMIDLDRGLDYSFKLPDLCQLSVAGRQELRGYVQESYDYDKNKVLSSQAIYAEREASRLARELPDTAFENWAPLYL